MPKENDVVIVSAARTAIAKFGGTIKDIKASILTSLVIKELLKRAGNLDPHLLDEVIVGECTQCFDEANTARTAALAAGLPVEIPAFTVQRNCSSSMQALVSGVQEIRSGDAEVVLAAGVESMSCAPYYLPNARWGMRFMNQEVLDALWESLHCGSKLLGNPLIMGVTAENLAEKYGISREEQDLVAMQSHNKAEDAIKSGRFKEEIVPIEVSGDKGKKIMFEQDEHPRFGVTMDDLAKLKPVFKPDGTVTAGNSSGINDGAAGVLLMTGKKAKELGLTAMAGVVSSAAAGVEPSLMGYGPVPATQKALKKAGMSRKDIQLVECNEAFAAQYIACERGLGLDRSITNVNGSGVSLGHPVGCTGVRLVVTLVHEMMRRDLQTGLATMCVGGGQGMTVIFDRN
ncbi:MAG: thiolase family protein [Deltaproteobacteria bacterium]|nr:thiolase family protein [Deltaproteobacteria bacterium]